MAKKQPKPQIPVIQLDQLTKRYGHGDTTVTALDRVDLEIEKGEFVAIMGPSGCGKTTLLNVLGLLDEPSEGTYSLDAKNTDRLLQWQQAKIRRDKIGIIFQHFNLLGRLNIIENVALPLTYKGKRRTRRLIEASKMLKTFDLQEREYYMPYQLSGGQLQRVAIARALVTSPSIILADEPTGNLDSKSSEIIMKELSDIHLSGNTIVMVTHNPDLTVYADRIIHMLDGRIARDSKFPPEPADPMAKRPLGTRTTTTKRKAKAATRVTKATKAAKSSKQKTKKKGSKS